MARRPSIKRLEARIAELEIQFREILMSPEGSGFSDNNCSYGCTVGCTASCTQWECCGGFGDVEVEDQPGAEGPPRRPRLAVP
jgi:hypothetical protein